MFYISKRWYMIGLMLLVSALRLVPSAHAATPYVPKAGDIWDVEREKVMSFDQLIEELRTKDFVLLGERHGTSSHHEAQAKIIDALSKNNIRALSRVPANFLAAPAQVSPKDERAASEEEGSNRAVSTAPGPVARPSGGQPEGRTGREREEARAIVMEMVSLDLLPKIAAFRLLSPDSIKDMDVAIEWWETGWPAFSYYKPVFEQIWKNKLSLRPGDIQEKQRQRWRRGEFKEQDPNPLAKLTQAVGEQKAEAVKASWQESVQASHCDLLSEEEMADVARLQMSRDLFMALQMRGALKEGAHQAVLIAGRAHTRMDRSVPLYLPKDKQIASIAFYGIDKERNGIDNYLPKAINKNDGSNQNIYNYLWVTPSIVEKDKDSCYKIRELLGQ